MAKGTAGKSASGASMSKYDVEVEGRLKALEAKAHEDCGNTGGDTSGAKYLALVITPSKYSNKEVRTNSISFTLQVEKYSSKDLPVTYSISK